MADAGKTEETSENEEKANKLFQQAQTESDCFADGTYTKVMFCESSPASSASNLARDAKGTDYVFVCRYLPTAAAEDAAETYAVVVVSAYTDGTLRGAYVLHSDVETYMEDTSEEELMTGAWVNCSRP